MYHISKSFRSNAGIKTSTATLTRGKYDVGTGGGSTFFNNGWRRTVYQPKSTSKNSGTPTATTKDHWRHLSPAGHVTNTRSTRSLGGHSLLATALATISLASTPQEKHTECAKGDKRGDSRPATKKSSTAKTKPAPKLQTLSTAKSKTAVPQQTLWSSWSRSLTRGARGAIARGAEDFISRARGPSNVPVPEVTAPATPARAGNGLAKRGAQEIATTPVYDNKDINKKKMARENATQGREGVGSDKVAIGRSTARARTGKHVDSVAKAIQLEEKPAEQGNSDVPQPTSPPRLLDRARNLLSSTLTPSRTNDGGEEGKEGSVSTQEREWAEGDLTPDELNLSDEGSNKKENDSTNASGEGSVFYLNDDEKESVKRQEERRKEGGESATSNDEKASTTTRGGVKRRRIVPLPASRRPAHLAPPRPHRVQTRRTRPAPHRHLDPRRHQVPRHLLRHLRALSPQTRCKRAQTSRRPAIPKHASKIQMII